MARRPRGAGRGPKKHEWIDAALLQYELLSEMIGRWHDGIAGQTRAEFPYDATVEDFVAGLRAVLASRT